LEDHLNMICVQILHDIILPCCVHFHGLVKNIGGNPNFGGGKCGKN